MPRVVLFAVGLVLVVLSALLLVGATIGDVTDTVGRDLSWAAPYLTVGAIVFGGLGLASGMLLIGLAFGRWQHPVPLGDRDPRSEGLQE
ncbi:MAG TPA: hypothetical protein VIL25_02765 [Vicinamibacterales bacterium]